MIDAFAAPDPIQDIVLFRTPVFGDDQRDVLANRHWSRPACYGASSLYNRTP